MKHLVTKVIFLAAFAVACRPSQKDPPFKIEHTRLDAEPTKIQLDPLNPVALIGAPTLWKKTSGKVAKGDRVKVAVVGTGIDYTIPDLRDVLAMNPGELGDDTWNNGFDDDSNGFADDVVGFDFASGDALPYDWHGHDTFVASVIAASGRANPKVVGVAPNAELLVVRYFNSDGRAQPMDAIEALAYAIDAKPRVIYFNYPNGAFVEKGNQILVDMMKAAAKENIIVVLPAGNNANQNVPSLVKMAAALDNVLVVSGLDESGRIAVYSNFGRTLSTIAAPVVGAVGYVSGGEVTNEIATTSVAAGLVAGSAALVSTLPGMGGFLKIRKALLDNTVIPRAGESLDVLGQGSISLSKF